MYDERLLMQNLRRRRIPLPELSNAPTGPDIQPMSAPAIQPIQPMSVPAAEPNDPLANLANLGTQRAMQLLLNRRKQPGRYDPNME